MSTDIYHIKVLEKAGRDLKLRVRINYYDWNSTPDATEHQFFVRLLLDDDNINGQDNAELAEDLESIEEETWEQSNSRRDYWERIAARYISHVIRLDSHNFPASTNPAFQVGTRDDYDALPYTDYLVTATDERWVRHMQPGEEWGTVTTEETDY